MVQLPWADALANDDQLKIRTEDILYVFFLALFVLPFLFWVIRFARASRANINKSLEQNEELLKSVSKICERAETNERHLAAIEDGLAQIHEELKRRPLS